MKGTGKAPYFFVVYRIEQGEKPVQHHRCTVMSATCFAVHRNSLVCIGKAEMTGSSVPVRSTMADARGDLAVGVAASGGMSSVESNYAKKSCKS